MLKENDEFKNNWKGNNLLILKLRNEVDARINTIINSIQEDETIVLDYSMLEDSYIIEQCDLLIKINFNNNYEFVSYIFDLLLENTNSLNMNLEKENYENIKNLIISNKESLNNINDICLVHTDIWDGNILIKNGKVSGIVDFSDLYFGDEIMTFYFHTIDGKTSESFLNGFNN